MQTFPWETEPEQVLVQLRHSQSNLSVHAVWRTIFKNGPIAFRFGTIFEIVDQKSREHHHFQLKIQSFRRTKKYGWQEEEKREITFHSEDPDEFTQLVTFIRSVSEHRFPAVAGDYHVLDATTYRELQDILSVARRATGTEKIELLRMILENIDAQTISADDWRNVLRGGTPTVLRHIATAARLAEYRQEYVKLRRLVNNPGTREQELQDLLKRNPWMFGSEYSELLDRRVWFKDSQVDYMLRRSSDGYLEVLEIKTPFTEPLFIEDRSHDCYHPSAKLSPVLGQVIYYIGQLDRQRNTIKAEDSEDPVKIRARIIIGRDGPPEHMEALRNLNGHLHRVEVITFDQLVKIARRVLTVFATTED